MSGWESDMVVLVSDKNMEWTVRGLLSRPAALNIKSISYAIYVHPERDPGCLRNGYSFLRAMSLRFAHALILFDHHGCGREQETASSLERQVTEQLSSTGWGDRAATIVLSPELEIWVWSDSMEVDRCLGWTHQHTDMRAWLQQQGLWLKGDSKPISPKMAVDLCLQRAKKPRSSSLYRKLAESVSFRRCKDPSFERFLSTLQVWFPRIGNGHEHE